MQIDGYFELPKDKRPPENIWDNAEKLESWFDRVFDKGKTSEIVIEIPESDIE